jgi:hypothetical protein
MSGTCFFSRGFCFALLILGASLPVSAQDLNVPLRVVESPGVARTAETITSGIPLPIEMGILSTAGLGIFDAGNREIPAQFKVLSRWHGRPGDSGRAIKWLLVTFQSDLSPLSERSFHLRRGRGVSPASPVRVTEAPSVVKVDTGPLQFTVSRARFNVIDTLVMKERTIIRSSPENGITIRDHEGRVFRSGAIAPESVVVEEAGPIRAVIRMEGVHSDGKGTLLRSIVRVHAYAGKSHLRVFHALRNDNSYGYSAPAEHAYLRDVHLDFKCDLGMLLKASFQDESYILAPGQLRVLEVDMAGADSSSHVKDTNNDLHDNFIRRIRDEGGKALREFGGKDGSPENGRDTGFMDLGNEKAGVTVTLRYFWQNFPKSLTAMADGRIRVGLWPEFGEYVDEGYYGRTPPPASAEDDYTFGGGRQKTHEVFLRFRATSQAEAKVREASMAFKHPLFATAEPSWHAESRTTQLMIEARPWRKEAGLDTVLAGDLERYERFQEAKWSLAATDWVQNLGHVTYSVFRQRGGSYGGRQFYNWMNFGDTPWGAGYCQGHYDWPYSTLLSFVRTAERPFLDLAIPMARHRMDIDQYHTTKDRYNISGGQRFEKGEQHGNMTVPPTPSHTWIHGLLLYWVLTGDEFAREAAEETLAFYRGYWNRVGPPFHGLGGEARTGGWSLMGLTELYDYLGETEALELARKIVRAYINHENDEKTSGYYLAGRDYIMPWMYGIYMNGLGKYYFHTGRQDAEAGRLLDRMGEWFIGDPNGFGPLTGGTGPAEAYHPYNMWYKWHPEPAKRLEQRRINMLHIIDGLAYAYLATGKERYLDTALEVSSDLWRYWTTNNTVVDRTTTKDYEAITIRPLKFPNTETKILGWMTRYGKIVHYAAYMHQVMPPIVVDVRPKGKVAGPFMLRFRVTRNQPLIDIDYRRLYHGLVFANDIPATGIVARLFRRTHTPFTETFYAPVFLPPSAALKLDVSVWHYLWAHRILTTLQGVGE